MSGENKLFIILFKLAKLVKSIYLYFKENSNEALSLYDNSANNGCAKPPYYIRQQIRKDEQNNPVS